MEAKIWTAAEIRERLAAGDKQFLTRGLMAIYEYQTSTEKLSMQTIENNGVGFNGLDAEILTSFAEQWRRKQWLSEKQFNILVKKMPKYSRQLAKIAEEKRIKKSLTGAVTQETTVTAEASKAPVANGWVTFPNGAQVFCQDLSSDFDDEGETVSWTGYVDGVKYILIND